MRRFYFTQSVTFAKIQGPRFTAQKSINPIIHETNTVKANVNVKNADIKTVRKCQLRVITDCKDSLNNITLGTSWSKQKVNHNVLLQTKQKQSKIKSIGKFTIMKNLDWVSIFGSELTRKCSMQYVQSNHMLRIPSVTQILNKTMSAKHKEALNVWKQNMIKQHGVVCYEIIYKGILEDGKLFHTFIQNFLVNKQVEVPHRIQLACNSVEPVLKEIKDVHAVVKYVIHPLLRYRGFLDSVVSYRNQICMINWKKSENQKLSLEETFDAPVQLAAYIGALNASNAFEFMIDRGFIVVAYTNGDPATIHEVSGDTLQRAWREWLERLQKFYKYRNL